MTSPNLEPNSSSGSSGNVWKWFGIGCGGLLVLGIGGIVALVFVVQRSLNLSFADEQAEDTVRSIVDYEIPGGSQGFMSIDLGVIKIAGVMSQEDPSSLLLIVGEINASMMQQEPEAMREQLRDTVDDATEDMTVASERVESRQLCGQTVQVDIVEGQQRSGGTMEEAMVYQTFLEYEGEGILINLTSVGENSEARAEAVFESLTCK